ncbi:MAG TPA: hypothetical protein VKX49_26700 [Bryobacteraceae bacterium]|nr:hypothetical protein [Bryobacteraceae bacterium]
MRHVLALAAVIAVFVFLARAQVFSWPYYYDEADYMSAASLGWRANYTGMPSQSLPDFVKAVLENGSDPGNRGRLSRQLRRSQDVEFYRHWHGPLYFYWLAALASQHLDERMTRTFSYVFPLLTCIAIYFGAIWLSPAAEAGVAALLGSVFYLWSYTTVLTDEIAPHQLFAFCAVVTLLLLMKWRATGRPVCWYAAVAGAACAFCTLEVALVLAAVMIGSAFAASPPSRPSPIRSIVLFGGITLLLWPAAIVRLSFLKAYLFLAYLALFRASAWGSSGFVETWRARLVQSPWEWALLALALIVYFWLCDGEIRKLILPLLLYAASMLIVLFRVNTETPRYMLPFLPALQVGAGLIFGSLLSKWRRAVRLGSCAAIVLLLFWNTYAQVRAHPILPAPRLSAVIALLGNQHLGGKKLLAPQNDVPMIHYYLPGILVSGYTTEQEKSALLAHDQFDAVLNPGDPANVQRQAPPVPHYLSSDERTALWQ